MRIGLIAGNGQFPIIFCKKARDAGFEIYAAAYRQEADPEIAAHVNELEWFHVGQVNRLIKYFKKHRIDQAVMLGGIKKTKIFKDLKPDIKAISLIASLRHTHGARHPDRARGYQTPAAGYKRQEQTNTIQSQRCIVPLQLLAPHLFFARIGIYKLIGIPHYQANINGNECRIQ